MKLLLIVIAFTFSIACYSQEKQVKIYFGKASMNFAISNGIKPLTDKERDGYDYVCDNMMSPMLKILKVTVDDSRRMIVTVKKISNADYNSLSKYVFDCSEHVYKGLESCICVDGDSLQKIDENTMLATQLGEYKKNK